MKCGAAFEKRSRTTREREKKSCRVANINVGLREKLRAGGWSSLMEIVFINVVLMSFSVFALENECCCWCCYCCCCWSGINNTTPFQMDANCEKFGSAKNFELLFYIPFEFPISLSVRYEWKNERNIWLTSTNQNDYKNWTVSATKFKQTVCEFNVCVRACVWK